MKSDSPCWSGSLPKPKKSLIDQKLQYYVQVFDKSTAEGRSQEYGPTIVGSESECGSDKVLAPLSSAGPAAIFPATPAGFAVGLGATPFVLGGLGVAAAGGTALVVAKDDSDPVEPPVGTPPSTPPPPIIPPPVVPVPPDPKLELGCKAEPASGAAPLKVKFFAYPAGGTGVYDYVWSLGDGSESYEKNLTHVYGSAGTYSAHVTVTSGSQAATCSRDVSVLSAAPPQLVVSCAAQPSSGTAPLAVQFSSTPSGGTGTYAYAWAFGTGQTSTQQSPAFTYTSPGTYSALLTVTSGGQTGTCSQAITVSSATSRITTTWFTDSGLGTVLSSPTGIACGNGTGAPVACSALFSAGSTVVLTATCETRTFAPVYQSGCDLVSANSCTVLANADRTVEISCNSATGVASSESMAWIRTSLEAGGARGRVTMDGVGVVPVASEGARQVDFRPRGTHRVEAVVDAARAAGLWRFDLANAGVTDGSLRVLSGGVVQMSPGSVVFRISGQVGERIAFTFATSRRDDPGSAPRAR